MAEKSVSSVGFGATYRPPVPLDIFSYPPTVPDKDGDRMTDARFYNYNGREIPSEVLEKLVKCSYFTTKKYEHYNSENANSGDLSGMIFVSERDGGLETLHITLRYKNNTPSVFSLAKVFGEDAFGGVRMEDSGSFAVTDGGAYLVYVSTKEPSISPIGRQPWTAVYKTELTTRVTTRLTPRGQADLSPSVHPSGTKIAVASFEGKKGGWCGEIEDLQTDIYVMNIDQKPFERKLVVINGGWPTWGSDNVLFFHRSVLFVNSKNKVDNYWAVFRVYINDDYSVSSPTQVTPEYISAMTPAAINDTTVAVAIIRKKSSFSDTRTAEQYRHIEIFDSSTGERKAEITQKISPLADHFNPFVLDGGKRIGCHRCETIKEFKASGANTELHSDKITSPHPDVQLFRVPGVFPTFSKDGTKLAFVDNTFQNVWLADSQSKEMRKVYTHKKAGLLFAPVWNQNSKMDVLYINFGPAFSPTSELHILAIPNVSEAKGHSQQLTLTEEENNAQLTKEKNNDAQLTKGFNNAFPCTNPEGTRMVFRSTLHGEDNKIYKNLYIMNDLTEGEYGHNDVTQLTEGPWTDTHCQWSPAGNWIVFSSSRDKPREIYDESDQGIDPGYFAVYLVNPDDPDVCVRVIASGFDGAGHVNHPFFSPDGMSIVVTADLAAVSAEPISLPLFIHSVRPYGDIFIIDIVDKDGKMISENVQNFSRMTHSRYENSTVTWTVISTDHEKAAWDKILDQFSNRHRHRHLCPVFNRDGGGHTWYTTGHLCIEDRLC